MTNQTTQTTQVAQTTGEFFSLSVNADIDFRSLAPAPAFEIKPTALNADYKATEIGVAYEGRAYRSWAPGGLDYTVIDEFLAARKLLAEMTTYEPAEPDVTQLEAAHRAAVARGTGECSAAMVFTWSMYNREFWPNWARELSKVEDDLVLTDMFLKGLEMLHENIINGDIKAPWQALFTQEVANG